MTLSVGLPETFDLNGVFVLGPARRVGDALVYPARVGHDRVQLREYWPADLFYRTAGHGAVAVQSSLDQPLSEGRERFMGVTRALEAFEHPFAPPSTGFEANGTAYRVTRTGRRTLGELLAFGETLPGKAVVRLAAALADVLEAVHAAGFLHLDIQPHTVAPGDDGIELTGFSTDRRSLMKPAGRQDGLVTPGYSPIELHDGTAEDALGPYTDIHAASALLRRLIVGADFIRSEQVLRLTDAPLAWPSHDVPPELIKAIEAGLKVHPEDRPASVEAWRAGWPARPAIDDAWRALAARAAPPPGSAPPEPQSSPPPAGPAVRVEPIIIPPAPTPSPAPVPAPAPVVTPASVPPSPPAATPGVGPSSLAPAAASAGLTLSPAPPKKKNEFFRVLLSIAVVLAVGVAAIRYLVQPAVEAETVNTYYVTRGVRVRPAPSTANRPVTELRRGEQVRGSLVVGDDNRTKWLKLKDGPHRGQYVWERNLSLTPRPALASTASATLTVQEPGQIRAEPRDDARVVGGLGFGDSVQVQGTTADGWSELALSQGGGVGYVRSNTLGDVRAKSHDPETAYEPLAIDPDFTDPPQ